ncbi:MAG: lamin tail domain-containing protein [Ignavibacteriaceae bacterium]|nr:lamin tail domain-containing protein [Ignavibacteriaceae bacterium]
MNSKIFLIAFIFCFSVAVPGAQDTLITFTEVMFHEPAGNNEFVEVFNLSYTESVDLAGYSIRYFSAPPDTIINAGSGTILPPRSYAVIFESDYNLLIGIYASIVPPTALVLKIKNTMFGQTGMSNHNSRGIQLLNARGDTVDQYLYTANNEAGFSDEKIYLTSGINPNNWANALSYLSTPGKRNSNFIVQLDAAVTSVSVSPNPVMTTEPIVVSATLKNLGHIDAERIIYEIYHDRNWDGIPNPSELIFDSLIVMIRQADSTALTTVLPPFARSHHQLIARAAIEWDDVPSNNTAATRFSSIARTTVYNDIVLNEIMYNPVDGKPEWIEVFNHSGGGINLKKWIVGDKKPLAILPAGNVIVYPNEFLVIAGDSSFANNYPGVNNFVIAKFQPLNNSGDIIALRDSSGFIIDSLVFSAAWGGSPGRSLERIKAGNPTYDSTNWNTCRILSSPGVVNTVSPKIFDVGLGGYEINPTLPAYGEPVGLNIWAKNLGSSASEFEIGVFEDTNNDSIPDIELVISDRMNLEGFDSLEYSFGRVLSAVYGTTHLIVKVIYSLDQDSLNNKMYITLSVYPPTNSIKVNEIMYSPTGGMPEWVELYNHSLQTISFEGWNIYTNSTPAPLTFSSSLTMPPGSYLVLASDSTVKQYFREGNFNFLRFSLPPLGDLTDGIFIRDNFGRIIDSVTYNPGFGGDSGYSTERVNPAFAPIPSNWKESIYRERGTPGRINSVFPKSNDIEVTGISINPRFPEINSPVFLSVTLAQNGTLSGGSATVIAYKDSVNSQSVIDSVSVSLPPGTFSAVVSTKMFPFEGSFNSIVSASVSGDQDNYNNYLEQYFVSGSSAGSIRISEVMHTPAPGDSRWIELHNTRTDPVNLFNWSINGVFFNDSSVSILPGGYITVSPDSQLNSRYGRNVNLHINNLPVMVPGSNLVLRDNRNAPIDTFIVNEIPFYYRWHSQERSFNHYANNFYYPSLDTMLGTPGMANSIDFISTPGNNIAINEIMFEPAAGQSEFIELYNFGNDTISAAHLNITVNQQQRFYLSPVNKPVTPGAFILIAQDSSIFTTFPELTGNPSVIVHENFYRLAESGAFIVLTDFFGNIVDSVFYHPRWYGPVSRSAGNRSLEKINAVLAANDPKNWTGSTASNGGTPLGVNSIYASMTDKTAAISISPNPFSPDGDGFEDHAIISYNLGNSTNLVTIKVFDGSGREVRTILSDQYSEASGDIVFDGLDDYKRPLPMGIYIIYLEAKGVSSGFSQKLKAVVVSARKL